MRPILLPLLLCTAAALGLPSAAGAITLAAGTQGRALMTWPSPGGLQVAERSDAGSFSPAATIAPPKTFPAFAATAPSGAATVLAYDESSPAAGLLRVSRLAGAAAFAAPVPFAPGRPMRVLSAATNARGDAAVLVKPFPGNVTLLTAVRGGPLGSPQELLTTSETAAVAIGADGRLVAAYYDFAQAGVHAQLGTVGAPLGPVTRLTTAAQFSDVAAAVDDAGTATIAFVRFDAGRRTRPTELVVRRAGRDGRFGATDVVARGGRPVAAGFASFRIAAAGSTTALAYDANDEDGRLGVAIARGSGRFASPQRPTEGRAGSFLQQPSSPSVAVDRAGDVLLAYTLGIYGGTVHVTQRRAGRAGFTSPRVLSSLGHGGAPVAALLSDRRPLVAWDNGLGDAHYTTRLTGRRPDSSPPRATVSLLPGTESRLRASNTAGVRIRCSEACLVTGRATLRTTTGRSIEGAGRTVLRAGPTIVKRFAFDPARGAGHARDGSILRVTIDVENGSGASREVVKRMTLPKG